MHIYIYITIISIIKDTSISGQGGCKGGDLGWSYVQIATTVSFQKLYYYCYYYC